MNDETINLFELSEISERLPKDALERYLNKLSVLNSDCPYFIDDRLWIKSSNVITLIPPITDLDIINYLIFTKSAYTEEEFRSYKSLDAFRSFTDGNVSEFMLIHLKSNYTVIKAKVN